MKLVKRIFAILMSVVLMAGTVSLFASAEDSAKVNDSSRAKDLVDVKLTEAQISALMYYSKHDSAAPVPAGFDLGTTLATWAINTALSYAFDGMMDGIFGGEEAPFPEILQYLEEINAKLDKILEELDKMAKAIDVIQQTIDLQEKQSYLYDYSMMILQTQNPISGLWNATRNIQKNMYTQTKKEPEVYRHESLLQLFLDQMGDSGQIASTNTHMDEMYRKFYSYTIAPYLITVNGKSTTANLFELYGQYARLIFPWENEESLNALKNYIDSVYYQYMIVAILESISLETRIKECESQEIACDLIQFAFDALNEQISEVSKAYLDCLEDIDEAMNDNYARLWHPKYDILFDKQVYQTEVPEEKITGPFKGFDFWGIKIDDFWSKMNQPVDGSLPKNERACLGAETDAAYNVYDTLLGIKNTSIKQILTDGGINIPATVEQVETPKIVLNVYDPEHPLESLCIDPDLPYHTYITVTGLEFSKTASEHEYITVPTYIYNGVLNYSNKVWKPNECFVLAVKSVNPVDDAYKVNYKWAGEIPDGVTLPTDSTEYKWHDKPATDKTYTAGMIIETKDGLYTFSGWDASGDKDLNSDGLMEGNVTYRGYWKSVDHIHTVDGKNVGFTEWTSDNSLPTNSGNYYLTKDITLTDTWSIPMNIEINLCLNGHVIKQTAEDKRCISISSRATLNIHDCNGDNCTHEGFVDSDGLWHLDTNDGTKSIAGGVITGSTNSGIYVYAYGHLNMYGGTIAGNEAKYGGGVYNDGVFNMYGGKICYNIASTNSGGGVFSNSAYTNMYGGTVSNNTAGYCGGGVHITNGKAFNMYNGTVSNNKAEYGGGICVYSGTLNMSNGTVSNNTAPYGGGVYARSGSVVLGGSSVIDNNTNNNLYVKNGFLIDFGTGDNAPTEDMKVGVTLGSGTGAFTKKCPDYSANFTADKSSLKVVYADGALSLKSDSSSESIVKPTKKDDTPAKPTHSSGTDKLTKPSSSSKTSEADSPISPNTGDAENMALWIVAFVISSAVCIVCLTYGRKRKKAE